MRPTSFRFYFAAASLLALGLSAPMAQAAPAKKKTKNVVSKVAQWKPGLIKFAVKGGVMLPREGNADNGYVVGLEASLKLPALGRVSLQGDFAAGDIKISPTRDQDSDQRYLHLNYILTPRINSPVGKFYYGLGVTQGWMKAPVGGTASKLGLNVMAGYQFPNSLLVEARHSFLGDDKNTDLGGTSVMAGYRF